MRQHLDNYEAVFGTASSGATSVTVSPAPPDLTAGDYYWFTLVDDADAPTIRDTVKVTAAVSGVLTFTPALSNDYTTGGVAQASNPAVLFDEADGINFISYTEHIGTASTGTISIADGPLQGFAVAADTTFSFPDLPSGGSITLQLSGDFSFTLTWPAGSWRDGAPPDLTGATGPRISVENIGGTLYMTYLGDWS